MLVCVLVLVHVVYDVLVSPHNLDACTRQASGDPRPVVLSLALIGNNFAD